MKKIGFEKKKVFVAMSPYKFHGNSTGQAGGVSNTKPSVFVAMSGGVDSSVAALLLAGQGYDVTGVYMKNWSEESFGGKFASYCPWRRDLADVRAVCKKIGIPVKVYNFEKEYNRRVIDYFFEAEKRGLTPNPDIICNREIKFGLFMKKAIADGADFIATGHYARIGQKYQISNSKIHEKSKLHFQLLQAKDKNKDQSYFLCLLKQSQLAKTLFPLGNLTKPEVRQVAKNAGLATAEKPESMGICFVGEVDFEDFLKARIIEKPGEIVTPQNQVIGTHRGLPFYTIGQRQGLNLGGGAPYFVIGKDLKMNRLLVVQGSQNPYLFTKQVELRSVSWVSGSAPKVFAGCRARIRHRQALQAVSLKAAKGKITVQFRTKQRAVTPGQFCAIYRRDVLLGGGVIK